MAALGSGQYGQAEKVVLRPLSIGMASEGSEVLLKPGATTKLIGFDVVEKGLRRLGGFRPIYDTPVPILFGYDQASEDRKLGELPEDFFSLTLEDGDTRAIVITNRLIYEFDPSSGFSPVYWKKVFTISTYSVVGGNAQVVMTGNEVADSFLESGDWVLFDTDTDLRRVVSVVYDSGANTTTLTANGAPTATPTTFKVIKPFKTGNYRTGWTIGRNAAWFVDGVSPFVFRYDGTWLSGMKVQQSASDPTRTMFGAKTITTYKNRLYFGDVQDGSAGTLMMHQRIRWSEVLGWGLSTDYIESAATNYQDLAGHVGPILRLVGLEELLVAFTTDAIFYGRETSLVGMPYAFVEIQSGGISLVGAAAVCGLLGSIVFVGQDDVYLLGLDQGYPVLSRIGSPVANSIFPIKLPDRVTVVSDPINSRILVGLSTISAEYIDTIWIWNYRTKGWSIEKDLTFRSICGASFADQLRYKDVDPTWTFGSSPISGLAYSALMAVPGFLNLYAYDTENYLLNYSKDYPNHSIYESGVMTSVAVATEVEFPELDFDMPDLDKTFYSFGVRLRDEAQRTQPLAFTVEGSVNSGRTWKSLGTLRIGAEETESAVHFRLTGSRGKFRLKGVEGISPPWTILECTIKVRVRGGERRQ